MVQFSDGADRGDVAVGERYQAGGEVPVEGEDAAVEVGGRLYLEVGVVHEQATEPGTGD